MTKANVNSSANVILSYCCRLESEIVSLARCSVAMESISSGAAQLARRLGSFSIGELLTHVDQRLRYKHSLNAVSKMVGLSRAAFTRNFRAYVGVSFHRYLIQRRIEMARQLLRGTDLDIDVISEETGFSSQGHFASVFRDLMGNTPARYREQSRAVSLNSAGPTICSRIDSSGDADRVELNGLLIGGGEDTTTVEVVVEMRFEPDSALFTVSARAADVGAMR